MEMRSYTSALGRMRMLAGDPALDFANTLHWRHSQEVDFLPDFQTLVEWCVPAGFLSETEKDHVLAGAAADSAAAITTNGRALEIRAGWREHLCATVVNDRQSAWRGLPESLAQLVSEVMADRRLVVSGGAIPATSGGEMLLLPLVRIALAILSLQLIPADRQIGRCEGDPCGGFFLNTSRSKPRRWCSMDTCGNRAKVRKFRGRYVAE